MKRSWVLLLVLVGVVGFSGVANATVIWANGVSETSGWFDVDKTWIGDDAQLCWAAAASNMLAWGGWDGGSNLSTQQQMFNYFNSHFTDGSGRVDWGTKWWFTGYWGGGGSSAELTDTSHQGFYSNDLWLKSYKSNSIWLGTTYLSFIADSLSNGYATAITIQGSYWLHVLTVWGVDVQNNLIWVTDSDNLKNSLDRYNVNNFWYGDAVNLGCYVSIIEADALLAHASSPVPEPATMLLLGFGLVGLAEIRRRLGGRNE